MMTLSGWPAAVLKAEAGKLMYRQVSLLALYKVDV